MPPDGIYSEIFIISRVDSATPALIPELETSGGCSVCMKDWFRDLNPGGRAILHPQNGSGMWQGKLPMDIAADCEAGHGDPRGRWALTSALVPYKLRPDAAGE